MGRQSKEEYLLGQAKHKSDIDPNDQSDLPGNSNDGDVRHKRTGKMRPQKYLREAIITALNALQLTLWPH